MRTPILGAVLAGALVFGSTAVAAASQPPSVTQPPSGGDMRQMHERMLRDYPEMGASHEQMLDGIPEMRGMHEQMMGGS